MIFFFFNDTATTEIYTLSLHDALPICRQPREGLADACRSGRRNARIDSHRSVPAAPDPDRKSTRLNSSHSQISYAVFCLKKKKISLENCINSCSHYHALSSPHGCCAPT